MERLREMMGGWGTEIREEEAGQTLSLCDALRLTVASRIASTPGAAAAAAAISLTHVVPSPPLAGISQAAYFSLSSRNPL
ncbi:hypothetical protein EYF80_060352 [Liparis tanakae]|uniref:Uncharacterized protein n=1 Tax=Liparis tanakae TaxID=230148 RepID=A0A4Z2EL15_9TELE|nr:hypothetical protein EYF80_060352 [Liparis tanakae]